MTKPGRQVLAVDDERSIRRFLRTLLSAHGFAVHEAMTGAHAVEQVRACRPDLILLDLGLPDMDGIELTRLLRQWTSIPIIVLSVRETESEKIAALDAGADDYLTKPFGPGELLARIRVALRRAATNEHGPVFRCGDLTVDLPAREVRAGGQRLELTPTEYELLRALVLHAGKVITHAQLIREVWKGMFYEDALHLLRVNISNLRHKLEKDPSRPRYITTDPGVGYRLSPERAAAVSEDS